METLNLKTYGKWCNFFCYFFAFFSFFSALMELFCLKELRKKNFFYSCMHFLEKQRNVMCNTFKSNWDSDFTGVSSSEAPPYLLLWHFIENKNSKRTLFSRISKMLKTKQAILFKKYFSFFLGKSSSFEKIAQKCVKTLF